MGRLTKSAHFIPIKFTFSVERFTEIYIADIVRLHGVPASIIFYRDARFTLHFWKCIQKVLGIHLKFSRTFHHQTDGQSERTVQTLEDMLPACVMGFCGSWNKKLPLIEFSYNNSYQASLSAAPFEALYGRKYRSLVHWYEVRQSSLKQADFITERTEAVKHMRQRL